MKHMLLACSALFLVPLLSGCCSCGGGGYVNPCATTPCAADYSGCLPATAGSPVNYGATSGGCSNCQADNSFSLPPLDSGVPAYSSTPAYGQPIYGQPTYGPEVVVGQQYLPPDGQPVEGQYVPQAAPPVSGSPTPIAPASPYSVNGTNVLMPPAPIPSINSVNNGSTVIPSPAPYSTVPQPQPGANSGPMVPMVPPPPAEPISQMRFRTYR